MTHYVVSWIEQDDKPYWWPSRPWEKGDRIYYGHSKSRKVDRTDIRDAKFCPTLKSAQQCASWVEDNWEIYEVEIEVKLGKKVE